MRFPREAVETVQLNYLMKRFHRHLADDHHHIKVALEEKDRMAWLHPEIEVIGKRSESTYIKRLYEDYLLSKPDILLPQISMPLTSTSQEKIDSKYRQYRMPNTFDFGKQSIKQLELDIQNELSNRGLLKKREKSHHRELYGDSKEVLLRRVQKYRNDDVLQYCQENRQNKVISSPSLYCPLEITLFILTFRVFPK